MKKTLSLILAMIMVFALFAGCGSENDGATATPTAGDATATPTAGGNDGGNEDNNAGGYYLDQPFAFELWCTFTNDLIVDMNGSRFVEEFEKATNARITFKHPSTTSTTEAFNLLIAGGDLPDVLGSAASYIGGGEKAVSDGKYLQLNELVEKNMPNYASFRARGGEWEKNTISDNGIMWALYQVAEYAEQPWTGLAVRKDWCDDLGIGTPETISDWENMLTLFKDEKGATKPLYMPYTGVYFTGDFLSAYGVGRTNYTINFYQVDGEVRYPFIQPEYRDYLETMSRWYANGLIDSEFMARDNTPLAFLMPSDAYPYLTTGDMGAAPMAWGWVAGEFISRGMTDDPNIYMACVTHPVLNKGDKGHFGFFSSVALTPWAITDGAEDPDTLTKVLDYLYSYEGMLLLNYGVEGESYNMVDGKPVVSELINELSAAGGNDAWTHALGTYSWHNGLGIYDHSKLLQGYEDTSAFDEASNWLNNGNDYMIPTAITLTDAEGDEASAIMTDINTLVEEYTVKIITGTIGLAEYETMVNQINNMNIDRAVEIYQAALTRYYAR